MPNNDLKIITIIGDSLSMVRPANEIFYRDIYAYKLQKLVNSNEYHVVLRGRRRNNVLTQSLKDNIGDDILFNNSSYIILHLGIVDCAPRLFTLMQDRILYVFTQLPFLRSVAGLIFKFQTKYRRFFTKHFPKTYVTKEEFKEKYGFIIQEIRTKVKPKKVFVINIIDTSEENKRKSFNFDRNILEYNKVLNELVSENNDLCELIDFFSVTKENENFVLDEGIHLSKSGHDYLAQLLYEKIKKEDDKKSII